MTSTTAVLPARAPTGAGLRVERLSRTEDLQALEGPWRDLVADKIGRAHV